MAKTSLIMGELFAGAGGLGLGFIQADHPLIEFQPIFAIDNDSDSIATYRKNLEWLDCSAPNLRVKNAKAFPCDIDKLDTKRLSRLAKLEDTTPDILLGGPPCQGYSSSNRAGKKESKNERNKLMRVFLDKTRELCPKMFLIENVQGVRWTNPTEDMLTARSEQLALFPNVPPQVELDSVQKFMIDQAAAMGYKIWHGLIDAADFGIPQHRMRFFLFGVREDLLPKETVVDLWRYLNNYRVDYKVTVFEAIGDLPPIDNGEHYKGDYHSVDNPYVKLMRQYM